MLLQYASLLCNRSGRSHAMLNPPPPPPRVEAGSTALLLPERLLRRLAICRIDYTYHYFAYNKHKNIDRKETSIPVSSKQNTLWLTVPNKHEYKHTSFSLLTVYLQTKHRELKGKKALNYRRLVQDSTSRFLGMA